MTTTRLLIGAIALLILTRTKHNVSTFAERNLRRNR